MIRTLPVTCVTLLFLLPTLAGCLEPEDNRTYLPELTLFDFDQPQPVTTWYHYPGTVAEPWAVDAKSIRSLRSEHYTESYW
jgi:hypothetical protein